ncbi:UNVERIFIED_CONTAM: Sec23ip [Trichonephila clavipes]
MVQEDTGVLNEGATCAWMAADEAVGCTHASFVTILQLFLDALICFVHEFIYTIDFYSLILHALSRNFINIPHITFIFKGENRSDLSSIYPRSSGETTESLSTHNNGVPMPNSHDSKYFQAIPNNNFQSTSHSSYQNQNVYFHYVPVKPHWLFEDTIESKEIWYGFSEIDSEKLEAAFQKVVPTDGGRYDVYLDSRVKKSVYFEGKDLHVRRSTWFYYNGTSSRCKPYDEDTAKDSKASPRVVKRGLPDGFEILPNEATNIDHLVFIVQGIGSFCDLRFRTVSQCVDGFRDIANKLIASHFGKEVQQSCVNRVEFLPVAWHAKLHTSDVGLDRRMQTITLPSIPKLRHFTNDTLIDILLYSSPSYCQSILDTVACKLNELYELFLSRNPGFSGKILVAGHSLGSLILFDILANQQTCEEDDPSQTKDASNNLTNELNTLNNQSESSLINISEAQSSIEMLLKSLDLEDYVEVFTKERIDYETLILLSEDDLKDLGLPVGPRKKLLKAAASKQNIANSSEAMADSHNNTQQDQMLDCVASAAVENTIYPARVQKSGMSLIAYPR